MRATPTPNTNTQTPPSVVPPLVNRILTFFYLLTILNLIYVTWGAIDGTHNSDYNYLFPVGLYALLVIIHAAANYKQVQREGGTLSDILWGMDKPEWRGIAFMLLGYALIFWATTLNPIFGWLYTPWLGATFGMLELRLAIPVMITGTAALFYQTGIVVAIESGELSIAALLGVALGITSTVTMIILITVLIRSQIRSSILVQELRATKAQLEVALHKEKEVAVLRERDRMAREMHDVLGHALVLVAVKIEAAQRLQAANPERAAEELEATKDLVRTSMADLRASLADLRSPAFEADDKPLKEALRTWAERTATEGNFAIEFSFQPETDALPATIQDALWRVGREAVLNIVKHARASNVRISLFRKNSTIYLTVMDDGVGILHLADGSARLEVEGHYGIRGMRERLVSLGGQLKLTPGRDGRGTLIIATIPLPPATAPEQPERNQTGKMAFGLRTLLTTKRNRQS